MPCGPPFDEEDVIDGRSATGEGGRSRVAAMTRDVRCRRTRYVRQRIVPPASHGNSRPSNRPNGRRAEGLPSMPPRVSRGVRKLFTAVRCSPPRETVTSACFCPFIWPVSATDGDGVRGAQAAESTNAEARSDERAKSALSRRLAAFEGQVTMEWSFRV